MSSPAAPTDAAPNDAADAPAAAGIEDAARFDPLARGFLFEALRHVQREVARSADLGTRPHGRHITAAELCAGVRTLAAARFGGLAGTVLAQWGLDQTAAIGRLVYQLVERGELSKCDGDRPEDFDHLFDLRAALEEDAAKGLSHVAVRGGLRP